MLCIGGTFEMLLASLGATNLMLCWSVVCGVIFWVYGDANLCNGIIKFRFAVLNQRHASRLVPQRFEFIAYLMWWQGQGLTICRQGLASMANLPSFFSNVCEKFEFFFLEKISGFTVMSGKGNEITFSYYVDGWPQSWLHHFKGRRVSDQGKSARFLKNRIYKKKARRSKCQGGGGGGTRWTPDSWMLNLAINGAVA